MGDIRNTIARRAAAELKNGEIINLGIGLPTLVANHIPAGIDVVIHSENGVLGVGPEPLAGCEDPDRANAGGRPITIMPGGSYFDTSVSFGMIRGGHIDATFLGTFEVDSDGSIASFEIPGSLTAGMGGAMDLLAGARTVYVLTEHCAKDGSPKLVRKCSLPLTGAGEADVIITERALFRRHSGGKFALEELATGFSLEEVAASTGLDFTVSPALIERAYA